MRFRARARWSKVISARNESSEFNDGKFISYFSSKLREKFDRVDDDGVARAHARTRYNWT